VNRTPAPRDRRREAPRRRRSASSRFSRDDYDRRDAAGEFIGVTKFTADGSSRADVGGSIGLKPLFQGKVFSRERSGPSKKAYLIDLFQDIARKKASTFHRVDMHGGYMEIDTLEDRGLAASWVGNLLGEPVGALSDHGRRLDAAGPAFFEGNCSTTSTKEKIADDDRRRLLDASVPYAIALQEAAGVDVVQRRVNGGVFSYVGVIADNRVGLSPRGFSGPATRRQVLARGDRQGAPRAPRASRRRTLGFALEHAKTTHQGWRCRAPTCSAFACGTKRCRPPAYPTREAFADALVPILAGRGSPSFATPGVHTVQLDDPHLCLFVDPAVRRTLADPDREAMHCVDLINRVGLRRHRRDDGGAPVAVATRDERVGSARDRTMRSWSRSAVSRWDQLMMEVHDPRGPATCDACPICRSASGSGLGCVDCRGEVIDPPEVIVSRVEKAMEARPPRSESCSLQIGGFAPGKRGRTIPIDEGVRENCAT